MKISTRNLYRIFISLIVALYSFVIFMLTRKYTANFWINYGFVLISPIIAFAFTFKKDTSKASFPFNVVYVRYFAAYAILELVLGTLLMFSNLMVRYILLIQIPILLVFIILIIYFSFGISTVKTNLQVQQVKVDYLSTVKVKLTTAKNLSENVEIKRQLDRLISEVQYSDYNSSIEVQNLEKEIIDLIDELKYATEAEQLKLIKKIKVLWNERNQTILLLKR